MAYDQPQNPLDEILVGVATLIDPTDNDRMIMSQRYRQLKEHLERKGSPLAPYLIDGKSAIYAQGSVAAGTLVLSGDKDDRFDLDAIVQFQLPQDWTGKRALDELAVAIEGFPNVKEIERCTRCVQLRFASMHLDVTILEPVIEQDSSTFGEIMHSPDDGSDERVPAHPAGFANWYRQNAGFEGVFAEGVRKRRAKSPDRLQVATEPRAAEQEKLPDMLPPRLDTIKTLSVKLTKRFLKRRQSGRVIKGAPSIYTTLHGGMAPESQAGLKDQLVVLAPQIKNEMDGHLRSGSKPEHTNPAYAPDQINDRWPSAHTAKREQQMRLLAGDMGHFISRLNEAEAAPLARIQEILDDLFGEVISQKAMRSVIERVTDDATGYVPGSGQVAPAVITGVKTRRAPQNSFHCRDKR